MVGLVPGTKIGKFGVQSDELIIHTTRTHFGASVLISHLVMHALVLGEKGFQIEFLLVGFVERVGVRLQPRLQSREYLNVVLQLLGQFSQVPGLEFAYTLVLPAKVEPRRFQFLLKELSSVL